MTDKENRKVNLKKAISIALLTLTTIIWGSAFVAQDTISRALPPFAVNFYRSTIGALFLLCAFLIYQKKEEKTENHLGKKEIQYHINRGFLCGLALFVSTYLQQKGITMGCESGKAGFITVMYILIVPLLSLIFKKTPPLFTWIGVILAPVGLFFLCIEKNSLPFSFQPGDLVILSCAFCFSIQILLLGKFSPKSNALLLTCIEFATVAVFSFAFSLIFESNQFMPAADHIKEILFLGLFSSGIAYTLQTYSQKNLSPTTSAIIMSLEAVFAMISGALILKEIPTGRQILGSVILFAAIIIAQIPTKNTKAKE